MTDSALIDALTGSGESRPGFPDVDQRFHLKLRAYVDTAMPQVFRELGRTIDVVAMRMSQTTLRWDPRRLSTFA